MNGIHLPRGRFTDALVAICVAFAIVQIAPAVRAAVVPYGFVPLLFLGGGWKDPVEWAAPLISQFLVGNVVAAIFTTIFLLIAGRYAEKALGGLGTLALFVAGAYGGAIARAALTPGSFVPTMSADAGLFAIVGGYLVLYGVPQVIPINRAYSRPLQILALAAIWTAITFAAMLASGGFEFSVSLVNPLGGLLTGALIARPLLLWRYRKA